MASANSDNNKTILYSSWTSSCAWRIRLALNLKKIPYELHAINLRAPQKPEELIKANPIGQIPVLIMDGHTIIESSNMLEYLEETRKDHPLLPSDAAKRIRVREIAAIIVSGIQPMQNTGRVMVKFIGGPQNVDEWVHYWINRGFQAVEKFLETSAGRYCVGDEITWADCCLMPQYYNALKRFKMDLSPYPIICRVCEELEKHPDFVKSHPFNQPDSPPDAEAKF